MLTIKSEEEPNFSEIPSYCGHDYFLNNCAWYKIN